MVIFDMWSVREGGDLPEGLIHGNFAFDILNDTWRGLDVYLNIKRGHLGNELLVSILAIPLYILFGNSLFVLCQVPILYSIGILILIYYICKRWFSKNSAKIASVLFVCAPVVLQSWAIYPSCINMEASFFSLLAITIFFSLQESKKSRHRILCSAGLGIVSGIGIFHTEIHLLTLGFILLFWFIKNRTFFIKPEFLIFILFLFVGLIPYFYLSSDSLVVFIKTFFGGVFSKAYMSGKETHSHMTTLTLMSLLFWPIKNILFSKFNGLVITLIGLPGLLGYIIATRRSFKKGNVLFYFMTLYCLVYIFMALGIKVSIQYYFFPIFAHMTIILAVCFYEILTKYFKQKRVLKAFFYVALFYCCFVNVYEIVQNFNLRSFGPSLKKQFKINGCCFYWPWDVIHHFPVEAKTSAAREVEAAVSKTRFSEFNEFKLTTFFNFSSSNWFDISSPLKTTFISKARTAYFFLNSPESYFCYGCDVSFKGLENLAAEIMTLVPEEHQEKAFKGLAVFYVNDNWLKDLIGRFEAGVIDKSIPAGYRRYFFKELNQKIINRYEDKPQKIEELTSKYGPKHGLMARYYNNIHLKEPAEIKRIDKKIDFIWGSIPPHPKIGSEFSVIWRGIIEIDKSDNYTFYVLSDEGSRLFLDDDVVIDTRLSESRARENSGDVFLEEGFHKIRIEYYFNQRQADMKLSWSSRSFEKKVVESKFFHPPVELNFSDKQFQ